MDPNQKSKGSKEEAIRNEIALLLRAGTHWKKILEVTGASHSTIKRVKAKLKAGESLQSKSHGGHNIKLTSEVLNDANLKYKINPFLSERKCAKSMDCSKTTIRNAKKKLGLVSKKRPRRQLLTTKTKESRVLKAKKLIDLLEKKEKIHHPDLF